MKAIARSEPASLTEGLFRERLTETIAWCTPRIDAIHPRTCLRSDETRPRILEPDYFAAVASVARGRRRPSREPLRGPTLPGRLMVYLPDHDLTCGGAEQASRGYFD